MTPSQVFLLKVLWSLDENQTRIQNPFKRQNGDFCENSQWLYALDFFSKKLNIRWSTGFWIRLLQCSFFCTLVEEKERYLDLLDDEFGSLIKQIEKFDELQMDILTRIDPQLLIKFDLVRANIEVWSLNVIYSCYELIKCIYQLHTTNLFLVWYLILVEKVFNSIYLSVSYVIYFSRDSSSILSGRCIWTSVWKRFPLSK